MTVTDLKTMIRNLATNLMQQICQSNIHTSLADQLMLDANDPEDSVQSKESNLNDNLISSLNNMKFFPHKKRKRYSVEQLFILNEILEKYPKEYVLIRKALNIPKSTFARLKNELDSSTISFNPRNRKSIKYSNLNNEEKYIISKLVNPPSTPKSIKCI